MYMYIHLLQEQWKYVVKYSGAKILTKLPNANKMRFAQDIEGHPRGCGNGTFVIYISTIRNRILGAVFIVLFS